MPQVSLYGTRLCSFCAAARQLLNRKGVSYDDISVDQDLDLRNEVMQKSGQRTVPQIWVGDSTSPPGVYARTGPRPSRPVCGVLA